GPRLGDRFIIAGEEPTLFRPQLYARVVLKRRFDCPGAVDERAIRAAKVTDAKLVAQTKNLGMLFRHFLRQDHEVTALAAAQAKRQHGERDTQRRTALFRIVL